ncbi:methyl-accepting chemotaxis protein [Rhodopseudomonas thermotolerans]|uniref:Methyl-accepting chemotaxis protein n=2 Tax=Rhodopseudomonas TaxID=1073 RepID=A0A336JTJ4_9BRAD|nr:MULTISPECIES: methyl-accepting chemotaxis protein [Rhodopseudomonas]RED27683.1 methyl-accepting chemotaxis protein [Rhodopseudomonas pentothenatexigens]REF91218.1 methyl-accepting chemotaxis protein [Rhodopseudomonas thermotolerans]SSW92828.1 methyl-accepting chemotaxis protein [Rhodopseudomonas pentothenatexigens]
MSGKFAKLRRLRPKFPQLGIRGSLFAAFAVIAGMAILISAWAGMSLHQLGRTMSELSGRDIPKLAASLQLATESESLASQAPILLDSLSAEQLQERSARMKAAQQVAIQKLADITTYGGDKAVVSALNETLKNIDDTIRSLGSAAKERLDLTTRHVKLYDDLRRSHDAFIAVANPAMLDAQAQMNAVLGSANLSQDDATSAGRRIEQLGNVIALTNLIASDLMAALSASSSDDLEPVETSFKEARQVVNSNLDGLPDNQTTAEIKAAAQKLMALGDGKTGAFKLRQLELDARDYRDLLLDETRKLNVGLGISVKQLVDNVRNETTRGTSDAQAQITLATRVMIALGALTLVGSALFVWLYVGRSIVRRIVGLQKSMQSLSAGDLGTAIDRGSRRDEIAVMAESLEVFRDNMIRARALSEEQDKDRAAKAERTERIEARIAEFEATVRSAMEKLQSSADQMQETAHAMATTSEQSSALVTTVASAAEETSVNVQTVATGTEQLASSIAEISRQVTTSAEIATRAVREAGETDSTMQGLADNAERISAVIDLIQSIASQTNLLALNATIEAARAGDAGRGFAVVAAEVKDLASQTAKATEEIRAQIAAMQGVTSSAVGAIRNIGQTITSINEVTTAITAAVEEQGAATREIARNIQHAAGGTSEVSSNIVGVSAAASQAGSAAAEVLNASGSLRQETAVLREEIDAFLVNIRAA